jgi:hypothetical protein
MGCISASLRPVTVPAFTFFRFQKVLLVAEASFFPFCRQAQPSKEHFSATGRLSVSFGFTLRVPAPAPSAVRFSPV